ncbi:MAG: glycosyltransferase [Chloroflexi bacterium]|nr:glycosyltransferase [Chloroflexota bacterium]
MSANEQPHDVLVVGWFPGADDQIAGRFVADQVAALRATGRVRPAVISFEPFALHGDLDLRDRALTAWAGVVRSAARERAFARRGANGPVGIPVARIGAPIGGARGAHRTNAAIHRATTLAALWDGWTDRGPALVHAHVGYPEGAAAATVAAERGLPLILTEHATYLDRLFGEPEIRAAYHAGARSATRIIAVGRSLADRISREFPDLGDRIVVIPNTVEIDAFRPTPADDRDPDELLWVGYRREVKGMVALLRAFRIVRDARPATRLRLIGRSATEAEEASWQRLAAELGVADSVAFEAPEDRAGVARAMERAALFVHPSRIETMGIVAVEALAAGLPVVAVDSGGVTEVLGPEPGLFGALVPDQAPRPLAEAILATLRRRGQFDPTRLQRHVAERYAAPAVAGRIADLYDEVLASAPAPGDTEPPVARPGRTSSPAAAGSWPMPAAIPDLDSAVVVVGFERAALDEKLAGFPVDGLGRCLVATAGGPLLGHPDAIRIDAQTASALEEFMALQGRARRPGVAGLLRAPARWLSRTWRQRSLARRVLPALTAAVASAADRAAAGGAAPVVICLGGIDIVAAEPLRAAGRVIVAPGGLRWLGDRRAAAEPSA